MTDGVDDLTLAWMNGANCRLYEQDAGPTELNIGSSIEPYWVPRTEAFRDLYAHLLLEELGADPIRIVALARRLRDIQYRAPTAAVGWDVATDLCDRAYELIHRAGAAEDASNRRKLLAGTTHLNRSVVLGQWIPDYQQELDRNLLEDLADAEKSGRKPVGPTREHQPIYQQTTRKHDTTKSALGLLAGGLALALAGLTFAAVTGYWHLPLLLVVGAGATAALIGGNRLSHR